MPTFCANLTMLYQEVDFLDRFRCAKESGFQGVEYLFPLQTARAIGISMPAAALAQEMYNSIAAHDGADLDHSALVQALERLANHQVAK